MVTRMINNKVIWIIIVVSIVCGVLFAVVPRLMTENNADMNAEVTSAREQPFSEEELQGMLAFGTPEENEYWDQYDFISFTIKVPKAWIEVGTQVEDLELPPGLFLYSEYETVTFTLIEMKETSLPDIFYEQEHFDVPSTPLEIVSLDYVKRFEKSYLSDGLSAEWEIGENTDLTLGDSTPAVQCEAIADFRGIPFTYNQTVFRVKSNLTIIRFVAFDDVNERYPDLYSNILSSIEI